MKCSCAVQHYCANGGGRAIHPGLRRALRSPNRAVVQPRPSTKKTAPDKGWEMNWVTKILCKSALLKLGQ